MNTEITPERAMWIECYTRARRESLDENAALRKAVDYMLENFRQAIRVSPAAARSVETQTEGMRRINQRDREALELFGIEQ
ncbi:MAG: hypothetical protein R6V19_04350 [Armatimonadota bacterium]